jgi:hypothetical protein
VRKLAVDDVKVGPADPAGVHADEELARRRRRLGTILDPQRLPLRGQDRGAHQASLAGIQTNPR